MRGFTSSWTIPLHSISSLRRRHQSTSLLLFRSPLSLHSLYSLSASINSHKQFSFMHCQSSSSQQSILFFELIETPFISEKACSNKWKKSTVCLWIRLESPLHSAVSSALLLRISLLSSSSSSAVGYVVLSASLSSVQRDSPEKTKTKKEVRVAEMFHSIPYFLPLHSVSFSYHIINIHAWKREEKTVRMTARYINIDITERSTRGHLIIWRILNWLFE